jgi:hypothetical protein
MPHDPYCNRASMSISMTKNARFINFQRTPGTIHLVNTTNVNDPCTRIHDLQHAFVNCITVMRISVAAPHSIPSRNLITNLEQIKFRECLLPFNKSLSYFSRLKIVIGYGNWTLVSLEVGLNVWGFCQKIFSTHLLIALQ